LPAEEDENKVTIQLRSSAFSDGGAIPKNYTCDGKNLSPPLSWSGVPESTRSLALVCEDPDAPGGMFTHWVIINIPADIRKLDEGVPPEGRIELSSAGDKSLPAVQGKNNFGKLGFGGPCPPSGTHRYFFRLHAIDTVLDPSAGADRNSLVRAIKGHILAEGRLMGKYAR
jgi:Raf kinase inhibitor-like YbhB/YbcL family protein